jgi:phosphomevalonate kinase
MKKRNLIFLSGFKNTGKDTVAKMIKELSYGKYDIVGFADAIKEEYYPTVGITYNRETEDRELKEQHRHGIIRYAEHQKQVHGGHYWIERALDPFLFDKESTNGIIIPDCRRTPEMFWYKDFLGGKLPKYQFIRENFQPHFFTIHSPDADVDDKDYLTHEAIRVATELMFLSNRHIENYGSLEKLRVKVEEIYAVRLR